MVQISLIPVTLRSVHLTLRLLGYELIEDDGEIYIWKKVGPPPKGMESLFKQWQPVVTHQQPLFIAEGHDQKVYDRSDVTDLWVTITGTDRTTGVKVVARLRSNAGDPDMPPAHVIHSVCSKCGKSTKIQEWDSSLRGATYRCTNAGCGHTEWKPHD